MARVPLEVVIRTRSGQVVAGASVYLYLRGTTTPVSVYNAESGGSTIPQPLTSDVEGSFPGHWVAEGSYDFYYPADTLNPTTPWEAGSGGETSALAFEGGTFDNVCSPLGVVVLEAEFLPVRSVLDLEFSVTASIFGPSSVPFHGVDGPASAAPLTPAALRVADPPASVAGVTVERDLVRLTPGPYWPVGGSYRWRREGVTPGVLHRVEVSAGVLGGYAVVSGVGAAPQVGVSKTVDANWYRYAVVSSTDDTVTVVRVGSLIPNGDLTVLATVPLPTDGGGGGVAVTPDGSKAVVCNYAANSVTVINLPGPTGLTPISVQGTYALTGSAGPLGVDISSDGTYAWIACFGTGKVVRLTIATGTLGSPITVDTPIQVALTSDDATLAVLSYTANTLSKVDTAGGTVTATSVVLGGGAVSTQPVSLALTPDDLHAYVGFRLGTAQLRKVLMSDLSTVTSQDTPDSYVPTSMAIAADGAALIYASESTSAAGGDYLDLTVSPHPRFDYLRVSGSPVAGYGVALTPHCDILMTTALDSGTLHWFTGGSAQIRNDAFFGEKTRLIVEGAVEL